MKNIKRSYTFLIALTVLAVVLLTGCGKNTSQLSPDNPVTLTMWHVYGSQAESPLNNAIDEFNQTVGKDEGIIISVEAVTSSDNIGTMLEASAGGDPGAAPLPDLFTAYPRVVDSLGTDILLDWSQYYSEDELSVYVEDFLEEGYFGEKLLMVPIAKSTELLFLNETVFEDFSEGDVDIEQLSDFDTLFNTCTEYYKETGKPMMQIDDFYHYFLSAISSMGGEFVRDGAIDLNSREFRATYEPMAKAAISGGLCIDDGYASGRWKTGDIISFTGSTAGILYLRDYLTYSDNTTRDINTVFLPYPVFSSAKATVVQRGGGLFAIRSDNEAKNQAAAVFAKWIAEEEHNLDFVTASGYLPVTKSAFEALIKDTSAISNEKYRMLYETVGQMYDTYTFHNVPLYEDAGEVQDDFEVAVKAALNKATAEYTRRVNSGENPDTVMPQLLESSLADIGQKR